jgi:hypothetical protein
VGRELPRAGTLLAVAAAFAALDFVPDPLQQAERTARAAADAGEKGDTGDTGDEGDHAGDALNVAQLAAARAPRSALPHLIAASLARDCANEPAALAELDRATRAEPWRGPAQLAIAHDRLVDAVEHAHDDALAARRFEEAGRALAAAVATGAVACADAYASLTAAGAPVECFDRVAGDDALRLETLVEHHAGCADAAAALAVAERLDRLRNDERPRALALAERRLGAATFAAGRFAEAGDHFRRAAELSGEPDALALERADAYLAAGDAAAGALQLLHALAAGEADAERIAGSLRSAADGEAAARALCAAGRGARDARVRVRCAAVFGALGQRERERELLAAGDPP